MKKKCIALAAFGCLMVGSACASGGHTVHWGYSGHEGPEYWGSLVEEFAACKQGVHQSPINITSTIQAELQPIEFHYADTAVNIINNGHTIQVNYDVGSSITVEGKTYDLVQFHFHTPSENQIAGRAFPMEAHLVHKDDEGNLAVISLMFTAGDENKALSGIWASMPEHADQMAIAMGKMNAMSLLPANKEFYRFNGSLTTPPCSEGVMWMVMKDPITVSQEQVRKFAEHFHGNNARPVQPVHARTILR